MALAQYREKFWFPSGALATNIVARVFLHDDNVFAPLFTDATGTTPLANPTRTDNAGFLTFWAEEGQYWIHLDTEAFEVGVGATESGATEVWVLAQIAAHSADTTGVHGIANTALLETQAGAQAKADQAEADAEAAASADATAKADLAQQQAEEAAATALAAHAADTTAVHGIANTADLLTQADIAGLATDAELAAVQGELDAHEAQTTNVHGIPDTSTIPTGAQLAALQSEVDTVESGLAAHTAATTDVHGISDTSELVTQVDIANLATDAELAAHEADTTNVHGITNTADLVTQADLTGLATDAELAAHEADTTAVHGIADTSLLATDADVANVQTALNAHASATTDVHGIADTSVLATDADLAGYLPLTGGTLTGDLTVDGANLSVMRADDLGGYRLRTTGGELDFEVAGKNLYLSYFANPDFTGAQTNLLRLEPGGPHLIGHTVIGTGPFDAVYDFNPAVAAGAFFHRPLTETGTPGTTLAYATQVTGDAFTRWRTLLSGRQEWGSGAAAADVFLERNGVGSLLLTGDLTVSGELIANGITDWINAKTFGATGDGVTDDTADLQAAINATPMGGICYIPNGDYRISAPLVVPPGVTVMMPHSNLMAVPGITDVPCRLRLLPTFTGAAAILFLNQADGGYATIPAEHRLINIMIDGSAYTATAVDGIQAKGNIQNICMHGVTIRYMSGNGIYTDIGGDGVFPYSWRLYRVMVDNNDGHGFAFNVMTDITMFDCQSIGNGANGFQLRNLANSQFTLCRAEWCGNHGYNFTGDWGQGAGAGALVMTGCSTDRNGWDGLHIESTGTTPIIFNGLMLRRDGRNNGAGGGGFAALTAVGATTPIVVTGLTVYPGTDDQGTGTPSPEIGVNIITGTDVFVLDDAFLQPATTPLVNDGTNGRVQIGPNVVRATGPTGAPVIAPTHDWNWAGTAAAAHTAAASNILTTTVLGEAAPRSVLRTDGMAVYGGGAVAPDTPGWYREIAGNLKTDSYVNMNSGGQSGGPFTSWAADAKALRAGAGGGGLSIAEGANGRMGESVLVGGTVTVANTSVTATTKVFLQRRVAGGTLGYLTYTRAAGASFTITSSSGTDTSTVSWLLVEPS